MSIASLVAPLRYDVVVRQRFFETARGMPGASVDEVAAVSEEYRAWFEAIEVPRRTELRGNPAAVRAAYLDRVRRSMSLLRTFLDDPVRSINPVILRIVDDVPTDTGKRIPVMLQPADGCHRLALLRLAGATELVPGDYRIERGRRPPTDNTHRLLSELSVPIPKYLNFVGSGYGVPDPVDVDDLLRRAGHTVPHRLAELEAVLAIDLDGRPSMTGV